ncbi:MAG: PorT family protein [Bacteroidetes bacterium]|nr:PorT family protein [Bacteroidota bacterium]MBU1423489.1 PorT family protein [Bacteroidota bacterium]MBU2471911.1 PorT family protein [Bacteroidota bacterium]MBU2636487.1 PorT family protein [Bacteroidota bacterium]
MKSIHKNIILLFALIVLFGVSSSGTSQPIKRYGAKIGVSIATWNWKTDGSAVQGIDPRLGIDFGAFVEWFDIPALSLISELHFVQKGMKQDIPITTVQYPYGTGEFIKHNIRLDYLSFAVLPKLRLETDIVEVYAVVGVRIDVSLSNAVAVEGREPLRSYSAQAYQSLVDRFKSTQLGGTVGIGAHFHSLLPLPTGIEFRYSPNFQCAYAKYLWNIKNTSFELLLTITN